MQVELVEFGLRRSKKQEAASSKQEAVEEVRHLTGYRPPLQSVYDIHHPSLCLCAHQLSYQSYIQSLVYYLSLSEGGAFKLQALSVDNLDESVNIMQS